MGIMRVRYIAPANPMNTLVMPRVVKTLTWRRKALFLPLNLCIAAALTPRKHRVEIVDESVRPVDFSEPADVVGISVMTCTAKRAYEIADRYRAKGAKVILGGIHASTMPEEAAEHADAVVIGAAEDSLPRLFEDLEKGKLKKFYRRKKGAPPAPIATPRRDLLNRSDYLMFNAIQISRGCPHRCIFCSTPAVFGREYTTRPVEDIVEEIKSLGGRLYIFADDNIVGNMRYARELFEALIPLKIHWAGQATILIARDEKLLRLMKHSGCKGVILGLESPSQETLSEAGKTYCRTSRYLKDIRRIQEAGISVWGSFLFGFDTQTPADCIGSVRFAQRAKLAMACFPILTPYPGTPLYDRLDSEGRILTRDWEKYTGTNVVFKPARMHPRQLKRLQMAAFYEFFSPRSILSRLGIYPLKKVSWIMNLAIRQAMSYYYFRKGERISPPRELLASAVTSN